MTESKAQLLDAIVDLARELPPATLDWFTSKFEADASPLRMAQLKHQASNPSTNERLHRLAELLAASPDLQGPALALALQASAVAAKRARGEQRVDVAWTGPATEAVPLRRVDQVLYELVQGAQREILVVTYATYKAERALNALRHATERGVRVSLIIELAKESGGKISFDGLDAIRSAIPLAKIFFWPIERRTAGLSGTYGTMHVKCLVADRKAALVSSANLTDHALEVNMELGLVVEGALPGRLALHFDQLIVRRELVPLPL